MEDGARGPALGATRDSTKALNAAFDRYFHYEDEPTAPAWMGKGKPAPARDPFALTSGPPHRAMQLRALATDV